MRSSLLEKKVFQNEEIAALRRSNFAAIGGRKRSELVTNASLRLKKMPEDIAVVPDEDPPSPHRKESLFSEGQFFMYRPSSTISFIVKEVLTT